MDVRGAAAVALAVAAWLVPGRAAAWEEAHQTGSDATVHVGPDGVALVDLRLRWRVVHGPLKSIDLAGIAPTAVVEVDVPVVADDGRGFVARAVRSQNQEGSTAPAVPDRDRDAKETLHIAIDDPRATLTRGNFTFRVR